jgi:hypothetical protein
MTVRPNFKKGVVEICYTHGKMDSSTVQNIKIEKSIDDTIDYACSILNECTRKYLPNTEEAMKNMKVLLHSERNNISFKTATKRIDVNIRNGSAKAEISYNETVTKSIFKCKLTYNGQTSTYKCYHPEAVLWIIKSTIEQIQDAKLRRQYEKSSRR